MTLLYSDSRFLDHETGRHPERPERIQAIIRHLQRTGLDQQCQRPTWEPATLDQVCRVHDAGYLESLRDFITGGGRRLEADTNVSVKSYDVALLAAGAGCDAVRQVLSGNNRRALCLVRPPGHHALAGSAMGFCLLNNIAIAARLAVAEFQLDRVLIVDWDVHHGNGTQDAFWTDAQIGFLSIHRWPFYPGTGSRDETGSGPGLGSTLNLPVEFGTSRSDYAAQFRTAVERFADRLRPQLILISAGFDAHRDDPIGSLELETEDFAELTRTVLDVAKSHCNGRIISLLEGGYDTSALAGCVELHLRELLAADRAEYPA